jgi:chitinase
LGMHLCIHRSECDPGWDLEWSLSSKCPLDVCCSEYGASFVSGSRVLMLTYTTRLLRDNKVFLWRQNCKTTIVFHNGYQDQQSHWLLRVLVIDRTKLQHHDTRRNTLRSLHTPKVRIQAAPGARKCNLTVTSFAFGTIDPDTFEVRATSSQAEALMRIIGGLKLIQQDLQIWIAIGGNSMDF